MTLPPAEVNSEPPEAGLGAGAAWAAGDLACEPAGDLACEPAGDLACEPAGSVSGGVAMTEGCNCGVAEC
jgi:hypothetical protein